MRRVPTSALTFPGELSYPYRSFFRVDGSARIRRRPSVRHHRRFTMAIQQKITPFLWYAKEAEEAAGFYTSIFPDSRIMRVTAMQSDSPSGPPGSVKVVEFVLFGQTFISMIAGPLDPFNHAVSFVVNCDTQPELDHYAT